MSSCDQYPSETDTDSKRRRIDWLLLICLMICAIAMVFVVVSQGTLDPNSRLYIFCHSIAEILSKTWIGIGIGMLTIGILSHVPREVISSLLGQGILRAVFLGVFLDICNHGILMIGAKLYQKGANLSQIFAFLIASPWNSLSLTFVLFGLVGVRWTLIFIGLSALIAVLTGWIVAWLERGQLIAANPNQITLTQDYSVRSDIKTRVKAFRWSWRFPVQVLKSGFFDSLSLVRWLLLGTLIAAALRAFIPDQIFGAWFGPSVLGLILTLVGSTLVEVCSEGSAPIASELLNRASAPGNAFTFLMAGVATDYTEIMVLRETTGRWKLALLLPLLAVPQIVVLGWILNQ